jgi:hypothetical protein
MAAEEILKGTTFHENLARHIDCDYRGFAVHHRDSRDREELQ